MNNQMTDKEKLLDERIIINSVVQINETYINSDWIGCLLQVDEVYSWGIMGGVKIPKSGTAYLTIKWEHIDYIGQAVMIPNESEETK